MSHFQLIEAHVVVGTVYSVDGTPHLDGTEFWPPDINRDVLSKLYDIRIDKWAEDGGHVDDTLDIFEYVQRTDELQNFIDNANGLFEIVLVAHFDDSIWIELDSVTIENETDAVSFKLRFIG